VSRGYQRVTDELEIKIVDATPTPTRARAVERTVQAIAAGGYNGEAWNAGRVDQARGFVKRAKKSDERRRREKAARKKNRRRR
jgi:hypothetical protein